MDNRLQDVEVTRPRAGAAVVVFTGEHDLCDERVGRSACLAR